MDPDKINKVLDEITPDEFKPEVEEGYAYIVALRPSSSTFDVGVKYYVDMYYELPKDQLARLEYMASIQNNKLFSATREEAKEISGVTHIPPLNAMFLRARMNPGTTIHLFHTKFKVNQEWFTLLADTMYCESSKRLWKDSQIG